MKTIQRNEQILRVSDNVAENYISKGWKYIPKSTWKSLIRDINNHKDKNNSDDSSSNNRKRPKPEDKKIVETPKHKSESTTQKPSKRKNK